MKTLLILSLLFPFFTLTSTATSSFPSKATLHAFRLKPNQDFMVELAAWAKEHKIKAASIVSVVGSFKKINLRYANEPETTTQDGFFEIVSIVGTFNESTMHLHAAVSNSKGATFGGHLHETGNIIYTTAEVVVAELKDLNFTREKDPVSTWNELAVRPLKH